MADNPKKVRGLAYIVAPSQAQLDTLLTMHGKACGKLQLAVSIAGVEQEKKEEPSKKKKKTDLKFCRRCGESHPEIDEVKCEKPRICYKCKGIDHVSKDCPKRKFMAEA
jgi:hypothetical protein